jgi:hypothetical protein
MVSACAAVRDYERAFEWSDRIAEFAERYGSRYMLAFCRAEYGAVEYGRADSVVRTPEQTGYALWWMEFTEGSMNRLARSLVTSRHSHPWRASAPSPC